MHLLMKEKAFKETEAADSEVAITCS